MIIVVQIKKNILEKIWSQIPPDALSLIKRMLTYDPEKRVNAEEALKNPWLTSTKYADLTFSEARICLKKLKDYETQTILQRAVLSYFATVDLSPEEEKRLQENFAFFDLDHDGKLSERELIQGYTKLYSNAQKARFVVTKIMKCLDLKNKGTINFTGTVFYLLFKCF